MNLKILTLNLHMWSPDSEQSAPWKHHSMGSSGQTNSGMVLPHYQALSNEIGNPKILTCPTDSRQRTENWHTLNDSNISYFINFDGEATRPKMVAFGDRRFVSSLVPANNMLRLVTNGTYQWEKGIHGGLGTLSFTDGSVRMVNDQDLARVFQWPENEGSRIQLPK